MIVTHNKNKLIETHTSGEVPNFVIVRQKKCKAPLIDEIAMYDCEIDMIDKVTIVTGQDYGKKIIVSKGNNKVTLTRMNILSRMNENTAKKLYVLYFRDDTGILHVKSFDLPGYYFEPTAYVTSLKEFVSAIGECNFYWLARGKRAFSLYDSKYAKTYSMNFEAINKVCPSDTINILYKVETVKTKFDNMDILKENMKSFIKEVKKKYNISYSEWNCKVYIKSYSYYSGEYAIEEKYDLNSEAF